MKKLSILLVLFAIAFGVKAQGHYIIPTIGTNIGYSFGISERRYNNDVYVNQVVSKLYTGFAAGVSYRYEFNKPFLIEAGLLYNNYQSRIGLKKITDEPVVRWTELIRYNQLSIPVYFGYKFAIGSKKIFSITPKIGLQFGCYLNGKYVYSDEVYIDYKENRELKDKFDVAQILAVEFGWRLNERLNIFVSILESCSFVNAPGLAYYDYYDYNLMNCFVTFGTNVGLKVKLGKL